MEARSRCKRERPDEAEVLPECKTASTAWDLHLGDGEVSVLLVDARCLPPPVAIGLSAGPLLLLPSIHSTANAVRHPGHMGGTLALGFGSGFLVSAGGDGCVRLWPAPGSCGQEAAFSLRDTDCTRGRHGALIEHLSVNAGLWAAAVGQLVAVGQLEHGMQVSYLGPMQHAVDAVRLLTRSCLVAATFGSITLWLLPEGAPQPIPAQRFSSANMRALPLTGWPHTLDPSPEGSWIAAAAWDGAAHTVRLWRLPDGADFVCSGFSERITLVCWSADSSKLATASGAVCTIWKFPHVNGAFRAPAGAPTWRYESPTPEPLTALAFEPHAAGLIACADACGRISLVALAYNEPARRTQYVLMPSAPSRCLHVEHIAWTRLGSGADSCLLYANTAGQVAARLVSNCD